MNMNSSESTSELAQPSSPHLQVGKDVDSENSQQCGNSIYDSVQATIFVAKREKLLGSFARRNEQSLDLDTILNRTVTQVRQFLECDRVLIYRFQTDGSGDIIVESVVTGRSVLGINLKDPCFKQQHIERYRRGHIQVVEDIFAAGLQQCHIALLASFQVRANLVVPIFCEQDLWGLLIVHHCQGTREWLQTEIDLLGQLTTQVGIAIQQAELLTQVKCINAHLESQVQKHTAQLQKALKFEALVRLITEKIRDSLDETQVLQTATLELAQLLKVERCKIELYNACQTVGTIVYEYSTTLPLCQGLTRLVADFPEVYQPLLQKQPLQYGDIVPAWNPRLTQVTRLAYPIFDNQGVLGNLWLTRPPEEVFDEFETRLVQQVANECAIAIRQARLYQASQAQVRELEKLERLKNEFLRTISHELRTPITSISLAVETLEALLKQEGVLDKSKFGQLLQILHCQCQREKKLIDDLLTLSTLEAKTEPLILGVVDLQTWIPPIIESFRERTTRQQQQLNLTIATDIPALQTNISDLKRILIELLNNACKYTPGGELITVSASATADAVLLSVSNSGVEISGDEMSRIFEPFYRIPNDDPWKYSGTGLGLALVRKLVRNLGASIHVNSVSASTTFTLQFNTQNHSTVTKNLGYPAEVK